MFGLASAPSRRGTTFGVLGAVIGVVASVVVVGGLVWSAATGQAPASRHPTIFGGSLVLDDYRPLTVIDLATGAVTVQLEGVYAQVGAGSYADVEAVTTSAGTILVNRATGAFNMLGKDNYVLGPPANGISLGPLAGETSAAGFADGAAAYIVRYAPSSTVSLVGLSTVVVGAQALAAGAHHATRPVGFVRLDDRPTAQAGGAAVAGGALWLLSPWHGKCAVVRVAPSAQGGQGLSATRRSIFPMPCSEGALETSSGTVALARPGVVELLPGAGPATSVVVPGTVHASEFLPAQGAAGGPCFLARLPTGWVVFGVSATGQPSGPRPLSAFGPGSDPVVPAYSGGLLYTLDQAQPGQPSLWTVEPATGAMKTVPGAPAYPAESVTEKAVFQGAQVLVDGPRVVFNNPESLLAVVVFTDGSHAPVVVNKSDAVEVSAAGPGDVNVKHDKPKPQPKSPPSGAAPTTTPTTLVQPLVVQPVTQQIDCASTTEKPYAPQISSISPSDESALVVWTYHLLAQQDCLPSTWSVTISALGDAAGPLHRTQLVDGQEQLLFTGLRPGTAYQAVVTAYISGESTSSAPVSFTTTAVGPGPPASVSALADGRGGWVVSWTACRGPRCEVPAASWTVIGSSCGTSFIGQAPKLDVAGSQTSVTVNAADDLGLLGDSLRFSVQGVSSAGLVGPPTSGRQCAAAWQPPDASAMKLLAAGTPEGQTVTADLKLVVAPSASPVLAYGGNPVVYTYSVGGRSSGPTSSLEADITGLDPAKQYQATVIVTPIDHPAAGVTVTSPEFGRTIPWPGELQMQVHGTVGADRNTGTVVARFAGLPTSLFRAQGYITCGSEALPVSGALSAGRFSSTMDLDQMGGTCSLTLTLSSTLTPDPYGVPSPELTAPFSVGTPAAYRFKAVADERCRPKCTTLAVDVAYKGPGQPAGTDWQVAAASTGDCSATAPTAAAADFPVTLQWPAACPVPTITVSWLYLGVAGNAVVTLPRASSPATPSSTTTATSSTRTKVPSIVSSTTTNARTTLTSAPTTAPKNPPTTPPAKASSTVPTTTPTTSRATSPTTTPAPTTPTPIPATPTTTPPTSSPTTSPPATTPAANTTLPPAATTTMPPTTQPSTTAPTTTTTVPPAVTTTAAPAATTTAPPAATTTSPPTTEPSTTTPTTAPASTTSTTPASTTSTMPASTTSTTPASTTSTTPATTGTSTVPTSSGVVALPGAQSGRRPGPGTPATALAAAFWAVLAVLLAAVIAGSLVWSRGLAPRARRPVYRVTEATT
jgi:hypothetical protein